MKSAVYVFYGQFMQLRREKNVCFQTLSHVYNNILHGITYNIAISREKQ